MGGEHLMNSKDFYNVSKNRDYWEKVYLDYVNNFLSVERFGESYNLSEYQVYKLINRFRNVPRLNQ
jgi:hypothetical protein